VDSGLSMPSRAYRLCLFVTHELVIWRSYGAREAHRIEQTPRAHSTNITNAWRSVHLELAVALAQQIFDRAKVFFIHREMFLEFRPRPSQPECKNWAPREKRRTVHNF
jgi:hypothetical protein